MTEKTARPDKVLDLPLGVAVRLQAHADCPLLTWFQGFFTRRWV